ncbi:MAG: hypothetical protein IJI08_07730, partial [Clostridia bacterium]|nr:hypothetical protein [Clostridia bacterium]
RSNKQCGSQETFEARLEAALTEAAAELIILAGFLSILSEEFTRRHDHRILNIHPSLIPSFCGAGFYGLKVHEAALKRSVKVTGATVHYVNEIPDGGEIIAQKAVEVRPDDTPETLQRRVMEEAEWILLPQAAEQVSAKILRENAPKAGTEAATETGETLAAVAAIGPAGKAIAANTIEPEKEKEEEDPMNVYEIRSPEQLLAGNPYPGRGIVIGKTPDGTKAAAAYFIMGRSENSRNRIFTEKNGEVFTEPFDASKVKDPSLIIYAAIRQFENHLIVTNGDQTDTIYAGLLAGVPFAKALESRCFEPDAPNYTPRISGILHFGDGDFTYQMSILKSADAEGSACHRYTYDYAPIPGVGHFLHTYVTDGNPIPTFQGEPERMGICDDIDTFTDQIWKNLNAANRISLYVRYVDLKTGAVENRLVNKMSE